jgi:hypothetical protein
MRTLDMSLPVDSMKPIGSATAEFCSKTPLSDPEEDRDALVQHKGGMQINVSFGSYPLLKQGSSSLIESVPGYKL